MTSLLEVQNLNVTFETDEGNLSAVRGVNFTIRKGESVALVGESGSGKSVTALSVMSLLGKGAEMSAGKIALSGKNLLSLSDGELRDVRGKEVGMIFQEPMSSLNPVFRIGDQIAEVLQRHLHQDRKVSLQEAEYLLEKVGISDPHLRAQNYPHELSGGMKQRVMIAIALACNPDLLIADEPTTALDVTIQAQILELLEELRDELGMAILLITHDLGVVAEFSERVMVMYAGEIVENCDVGNLFQEAAHPYTRALLRALPSARSGGRLESIEGSIPSPFSYPEGCAFFQRCPEALDVCERITPPETDLLAGRKVRCWLHGGDQ
jgi:peptide/nickel transport system ATP-binding protein